MYRITFLALGVIFLGLACSTTKTIVSGQVFSQATESQIVDHSPIKIVVINEKDFNAEMAKHKDRTLFEMEKSQEVYKECRSKAVDDARQLGWCRDGYENAVNISISFLLTPNQKSVASATLDADGKFAFTAPSNARYVLLTYVNGNPWMEKVRLSGKTMEVQLSDKNRVVPEKIETFLRFELGLDR